MLDNYRDLIDDLLGAPMALRTLVGDRAALPPEAAALIATLRDRDGAVLARLQTMTREREPYLPVSPRTTDKPASIDGETLLGEFDTARGELVSLLMNLTLRDWERKAIDASLGEITVADEVERHVEFDEEHRGRLEAALGG